MSWKNIAALTLAVSLLGGCSVVERLVYRIDINQGNYLDQNDINTLRYGMNKEQVSYVLGSPMLVEPEYPNTWYYVYYHKPGHDEAIQKNLVLTFDAQNKLTGLSGDYQSGPNFMDPIN
ncbi:outer membrane protein assembly factor BamE [Photobacterium proteolyticum]|uniref:Outer membrane protein assembly factor BamE n=2 Tax=Photobacterium TaxID=657 RepID=A0A1Q9GX62_9GAMM|nr:MULTISPECIES: outer membrane protein assembly factor BamE [Photobacterium]MCG7586206.1 outer membrane protein assembly factor BamE [Photobacterium sp. OFAV2-7]NBI52391.1 outer membrane protein assembly factor BamE [Photobacterium alginatilyticum]OLQ79837.1 outer membrane protein assembly factor BamE [Photobacterium proteolyticum]